MAQNKSEIIAIEDLMSGKITQKKLSELSFEDALLLLEKLVSSVEKGEMPLEESLQSYEMGAFLVKHLRSLLSGAEQKLKSLQLGIDNEENE